jgi:hypothetical protein
MAVANNVTNTVSSIPTSYDSVRITILLTWFYESPAHHLLYFTSPVISNALVNGDKVVPRYSKKNGTVDLAEPVDGFLSMVPISQGSSLMWIAFPEGDHRGSVTD